MAAELAQVARLQRDLSVARQRYIRALGELGESIPEEVVELRSLGRPDPVEPVELRFASFDDLRSLGLSATQAKRVLDRVDAGEVTSPDDLSRVPGIPRRQLAELKLALGG